MSDVSIGFEAIARESRTIGVRNRVLVLPTVICSREVASRIAERVPGAFAAPHDLGCGQIGADRNQTRQTLAAVGTNPNIAGVVVVGLGCEQAQSDAVAEDLEDQGVPTKTAVIQEAGGVDACVEEGVQHASTLTDPAASKVDANLSDVTLGVVSSDYRESTVTTADRLVGQLSAAVLDAGGRVVVAGIERFTPHLSSAHEFVTDEPTADTLSATVERYRNQTARTPSLSHDVRTWEFEELAALWDGHPIEEVVAYGDQPSIDSGVAVLDAPARFEEAATGLTAAGAQAIVHATAEGIPTGHPITPVLKVTGNSTTYDALSMDIDLNARSSSTGEALATLENVLGGTSTCAEVNGLNEFVITQVGPSV